MINVDTGSVFIYENNIELSPALSRDNFIQLYPQNSVKQIRDMNNGYIWYDLKEKIYPNDNQIAISLCFAPNGYLQHIHIYPQYYGTEVNRSWSDWSPEDMERDKEYCNNWLTRYCGLKNSFNQYSWGELSSFSDPRSCTSGIIINYVKRA